MDLKFGDWVWAWDDYAKNKAKRFYLGYYDGYHYVIANGKTPKDEFMIYRWKHAAPYVPEIDWTKVPQNTPVQVRDTEGQCWYDAHFALYLPCGDLPYLVFADRRGNRVPLDRATRILSYRLIRLHPNVKAKEEWLKQ